MWTDAAGMAMVLLQLELRYGSMASQKSDKTQPTPDIPRLESLTRPALAMATAHWMGTWTSGAQLGPLISWRLGSIHGCTTYTP